VKTSLIDIFIYSNLLHKYFVLQRPPPSMYCIIPHNKVANLKTFFNNQRKIELFL